MQIELSSVTKQLSGVPVLEAVTLSIAPGQIVVVLGANGAGKTTLLHLLGGLYQPDSGEILVDKVPLSRDRLEQRRRLHYLPDLPLLHPLHTPIEYILFAVDAYGMSSEQCDGKIVELLTEFDMLPVADCPCKSLSRGQRYKASLIALLAIDPEFWIMDEPFTSGMDPLGLSAMRNHMLAARERGRTVIYSTQLVEIAKQTSDRVCLLSDSKVVAFEPAHRLTRSEAHSDQLNQLLEQLSSSNQDEQQGAPQ